MTTARFCSGSARTFRAVHGRQADIERSIRRRRRAALFVRAGTRTAHVRLDLPQLQLSTASEHVRTEPAYSLWELQTVALDNVNRLLERTH